MKRFLSLLIFVGVSSGFTSAQYIPGVLDWIHFPHDFKFEENYRPFTNGMGKLEFSVADSSGDIFTNPAKFYSKSGLFLSPSFYFYNLKPNVETQDGKENYGLRERVADVPIGIVLNQKKFYWAATATFSDYKSRYYQSDYEETYSGPSLFGLVGYRVSENSQFGASYKYTNYTTKLENSLPDRIYTSQNKLKMGFGYTKGIQRWHFLGSYYFTGYETSEGSDSKIESNGLLGQIEYQRKITELINSSFRLTFDHSYISSASGISTQDSYKNAGGAGVGINSYINKVLIAAELEFQLLKFKFKPPQPDGSSTSQYNQRNFVFRAGINVPLSESFSWTAGVNYFRMSVDERYESNSVSEFFLVNEPTLELNKNALTTGLRYRTPAFQIHYQFSYGNEPYRNYSTASLYSTNLFYNRIIVEYRL